MSKADERREEQEQRDLEDLISMNARPVETATPPGRPDSWAGYCGGWRGGIHERTRESRLAGVFKCKWCTRVFDPPNETDLQMMRERALAYQRSLRRFG